MENDIQGRCCLKQFINIFVQAIRYLLRDIFKIFIMLTNSSSITILFNKSYEFNSS